MRDFLFMRPHHILPTRKQLRLPEHDYGVDGCYFITLCVYKRLPIFGHVANKQMFVNPAGRMTTYWWYEICNHFPNVRIDSMVVMPNHIHGIIEILPVGADRRVRPLPNCHEPLDHPRSGTTRRSSPTVPRIMQWFKTMTTNAYIRSVRDQGWPRFKKHLWQRSYHEHIIRNERDLHPIREYIRTNPQNWESDDYHQHA